MENKPWYFFGKCTPYPKQIPDGTLPRMPYKKFKTKEECQKYVDKVLSGKKKWNVLEIMLKSK